MILLQQILKPSFFEVKIMKALLLFLVLCSLSYGAEVDPTTAKFEALKKEFEAVLDKFEDKEAAQLCVALAGKADLALLVNRLKTNPEFSSWVPADQTIGMTRAVANLVGYCIDKISSLAPIARSHLGALLDPNKKITEEEVEGILLYSKAIDLAMAKQQHSLSEDIGQLLAVIERHKKTQESTVQETFGKMQDALSAKKKLHEEITDFENKQRLTMNSTLLIILIASLCLCCYWVRKKKSMPEPEEKEDEYELTGTPEEQEKKTASMKKLVDTLALMDQEIEKMTEELAELKKR